jgi:urease accessory protein
VDASGIFANWHEDPFMKRAIAVVRGADVDRARVVDTVVLDHEGRNRRRRRLVARGGAEFLLDLERPSALDDGDALVLEDGDLIAVVAGDQDLVEIRADTPRTLMTLAWHIGNRHTPAEIGADFIALERDHVLEEMVVGLGGRLAPVHRPFRPERGAYDHGGGDHHHHDHGHDHHHDHGHDHGEEPGDGGGHHHHR